VLIAGAATYTTRSVASAIQPLETGRDHLLRVQAALDAVTHGDTTQMDAARGDLRTAEAAFRQAGQRVNEDLAWRGFSRVPAVGDQVRAVSTLAAIGLELTGGFVPPADLVNDAVRLKARYEGRTLSRAEGLRLLQEAGALATRYAAAPDAVEARLRAAHEYRAEVRTTGLVPQLRTAYAELDAALAQADDAYLQYRDVRRVLTQYLGIHLGRA